MMASLSRLRITSVARGSRTGCRKQMGCQTLVKVIKNGLIVNLFTIFKKLNQSWIAIVDSRRFAEALRITGNGIERLNGIRAHVRVRWFKDNRELWIMNIVMTCAFLRPALSHQSRRANFRRQRSWGRACLASYIPKEVLLPIRPIANAQTGLSLDGRVRLGPLLALATHLCSTLLCLKLILNITTTFLIKCHGLIKAIATVF